MNTTTALSAVVAALLDKSLDRTAPATRDTPTLLARQYVPGDGALALVLRGDVANELHLAARAKAGLRPKDPGDPWHPAPTVGTLLRLAEMNLRAKWGKGK